MFYAPFYELFPELAKRETRSVTIKNNPSLPEGEYGLIEAYCNEPGCDCRRVMFNIFTPESTGALAVAAYGWESEAFYARWFGRNDLDIIQQMQGPILNPDSPQSEVAPALLQLVNYVLQDEAYGARLKRHYQLFKQAVNVQAGSPSQHRLRRSKPKARKGKRRK
jgi:hypothetical protein